MATVFPLASLSLMLFQAVVRSIGLMILPGDVVMLLYMYVYVCPGFVGGREGKFLLQSYVL